VHNGRVARRVAEVPAKPLECDRQVTGQNNKIVLKQKDNNIAYLLGIRCEAKGIRGERRESQSYQQGYPQE
jgi:hypothetical protein